MNKIQMTVPQYFKEFIDNKINLDDTSKICCPFHKEDTPSFSYQSSTGRWRCFGACKVGGGIIELHRVNYKLNNNKEAEQSLLDILGIKTPKINSINDLLEPIFIDEDNIELNRVYKLCLLYANDINKWLAMDYVMSQYPVDIYKLKELLIDWGVSYE